MDAVAAGFTVRELKCASQPGPSVCSRGSRGLKVEGLGGPSFKGCTWNERGCCRAGGLQLLKRPRTAERCHRSTHPLCLWFPGSPLPSPGWPAVTSVCPWLRFLVRPSGEAACCTTFSAADLSRSLASLPLHARLWTSFLPHCLWTRSSHVSTTCTRLFSIQVHTPHPQAVYPPSQMEGSGGPSLHQNTRNLLEESVCLFHLVPCL